jgi:hypothetical protein
VSASILQSSSIVSWAAGATANISLASTLTPGSSIVLLAANAGTGTDGISDTDSGAYSSPGTAVALSSARRVTTYYRGNSSSSASLTIHLGGASSSGGKVRAFEVSGLDTSGGDPAVDAHAESFIISNSVPSLSVTTLTANDVVFAVAWDSVSAPSVDAGYTSWGVSGTNDFGEYNLDVGAIGAKTLAFGASGSQNWCAAIIAFTILPAPTVSLAGQTSAATGATATLAPTYGSSPTSYQWQSAPITSLLSNVPGTWADIGGATSSTYTTPAVSSADNGTWFRVKATNAAGTTTSSPIRLFITGLGDTGFATVGGWLSHLGWAFQHNLDRGYRNALIRQRFWPGDQDRTEATVWSDWFGISQSASPGATVALTGVAGTGSAGSIALVLATALTADSATGSVGAVAPVLSRAITADSAAGSVGSVAVSATVALTGVTGTAAPRR